jgi:co-chaperonin GroES (HSP10)
MSELIELPDNLKEPPFEGTVIRVGSGRIIPGVGLYPLVVKVGDYVHFNRYCGVDIILGKKPFKVLREDELLFIKRNAIA